MNSSAKIVPRVHVSRIPDTASSSSHRASRIQGDHVFSETKKDRVKPSRTPSSLSKPGNQTNIRCRAMLKPPLRSNSRIGTAPAHMGSSS